MHYVLNAGAQLFNTMVLLLCSPTAIMAQPFAQAFNADEQLTASAVSLSSIAAVVVIPFWTVVLTV
jgi:predicted permease